MIGLYTFWQDGFELRGRAPAFAAALRQGMVTPRAAMANGALLCDGADPGRVEPLRTPNGDAVLFAGHIDNRKALRAELGLTGAGDAALYAAAYGRWGEAVDHRVIGQYATILVEASGKRVRLARSPITAPPLHIWRDGDRLIVASTPQAIFADGEIARELDDQKIADTLYLNFYEERRGWFRGVTRLPRGSRAWITPDGIEETRYYRWEDIAPVRYARDSDYVEAADALFREATAAALDGFERPAISLSGGLDSQAVAAYAMRAFPDGQLLSYTSVPQAGWTATDPRQMTDERGYVEALAAMYPQLQPRWIDVGDTLLSEGLREEFAAMMVVAPGAANLTWLREIGLAARDAGADVLLSGLFGNLTFSYDGDGLLADMLRQGRLWPLARELWLGGPRAGLPRRSAHVALQVLPPAVRDTARRWIRGTTNAPLETWSPLHPDYARDLRVAERAREMGCDARFPPIRSVRDFRVRTFDNAVNELGDISAGQETLYGVARRDPTRYRPLLEFCLAIPPEQYLNRGRTRWLARRMLAGKIPAKVVNERRKGLQSADWAARIRANRQAVLEELEWLENDPAIAGRLNLARLKQALETMPEDDRDIGTVQQKTLSLALIRGLTTARFIRFIDGRNDV